MCLAIPGKVIKKSGETAKIEFDGLRRNVNIMMVPDIKKGEYCLVHAGFAIEKIDRKYAMETAKYLEEMNAAAKEIFKEQK
ncbi:MAG TPA: HypC/HybG/HupF family hydrogenase formation chaperone [Candidatus Goldiibacteriota bacterium]|nr:HypC/HybG/HupF family hydrogenase formation chaperone [Candidatus Goldiibacteriota bacterium]